MVEDSACIGSFVHVSMVTAWLAGEPHTATEVQWYEQTSRSVSGVVKLVYIVQAFSTVLYNVSPRDSQCCPI